MRFGLLILAAVLAACGGCQLAPTAFPKELGDVARAAATSMTDQAVWETMVANVNGQVIDPGMEVSAGVLYVATARLRGVSGQVGISGTGSGSGEGNSPEASAAIRAVLSDPSFWAKISDAIASRIGEGGFRGAPPSPDPAEGAPDPLSP
ncbi:MAG: hypothetical protein IT450_17975 [Phycisphaerales bacterium]|nr:hypothetical protein [Phycisphaerales bacterium]